MKEVTFWKPMNAPKRAKARIKVRTTNKTLSSPKTKVKCYQGDKLDRQSAVYVEGARFMCANCLYYRSPGKCAIVKGVIHPGGCCNLFKNKSMMYKR